jgi:hypothetical protein
LLQASSFLNGHCFRVRICYLYSFGLGRMKKLEFLHSESPSELSSITKLDSSKFLFVLQPRMLTGLASVQAA